jgi:hypothetical protein
VNNLTMPPKKSSEDDRGSKAKAQKAAAKTEKDSAETAKREAAESAKWMDGADVRSLKRAEEAAKAAAEREARKKEKEDLLRKEEEELPSMRKLRGTDKVAVRKAMKASEDGEAHGRDKAPVLEARTIEQAIAVLSVATGGAGVETDSSDAAHEADLARVSAITASVAAPMLKEDDKHPERRMKAAYKRYEEREFPLLKAEFPSLRKTQLNDMLWRKFQKSPENPMNASTKAYDAK